MEKKNFNIPAPQHSNTPLSKGFTLIEIMLVVVVILIATGIAVPKLSGSFASTRMKDAVRSTIRTARYARSMSILKQKDCTLSFKTGQIRLTCGDEVLAERRLSEDIEINGFENLSDEKSSDKTVLYYANGMNDGFELTLTDADHRSHTITCHPFTGKVTLDD